MSLALQSIFALILKFSELLLIFTSLQVWRTLHALHLLSLQWFIYRYIYTMEPKFNCDTNGNNTIILKKINKRQQKRKQWGLR